MHLGIIELDWSALMILINIFILFLIMKKYFFEKIHDFMEARSNAVKDQLDEADRISREADEKLETYEKKIANVEEEGREIIRASRAKADDQTKLIIDEAHAEAEKIHAQAKRDVEREKEMAVSDMRAEIANLSILAAEQILKKEVDAEGQDEIINAVIEEAEEGKWQN